MLSPVWKGMLIGSSLGIFAYLFGVIDNISRGVMWGIIGGVLAGLTMRQRMKNKDDK